MRHRTNSCRLNDFFTFFWGGAIKKNIDGLNIDIVYHFPQGGFFWHFKALRKIIVYK